MFMALTSTLMDCGIDSGLQRTGIDRSTAWSTPPLTAPAGFPAHLVSSHSIPPLRMFEYWHSNLPLGPVTR